MHRAVIRKIALAGILTAIGVLGGDPVGPCWLYQMLSHAEYYQRCRRDLPGALVFLGTAFCISLLRNILGTGTIMAFPGSMCGALLAGLIYQWKPRLWASCLGEIVGTGILSAFLAWPIAIFVLGKACGPFTYFLPFMAAALTGVVIASVLIVVMDRTGALSAMHRLADQY